MKEHTIKQKKEIAEKADKMQKADISQKEIAEIFKIPVTKLKHWLKDFRDGKFDKIEEPETQPVEQIDYRPLLERIAKALENDESTRALGEGVVKACIKLDLIIKKISDIPADVFEELEA